MTERVKTVSLVDAVTDHLRRRVISGGELIPGTTLSESDVAGWYEVARPTAKAAIEALVRERLLVRGAHKTARVVSLSADDVRDIYLSREVIERETVRRLALTRSVPGDAVRAHDSIAQHDDQRRESIAELDLEFHTALVEALGSRRLREAYRGLASEVMFCMSQVQGADLLPLSLIVAEHGRLLDLIAEGDGDAATALVSEHIHRASTRLSGHVDALRRSR